MPDETADQEKQQRREDYYADIRKQREEAVQFPLYPTDPNSYSYQQDATYKQNMEQSYLASEADFMLRSAQASAVDDRGFPLQADGSAWDYRTAQLDPYGRTLPEGAHGWTPYAKPDFGGGILDYFKSKIYKIQSSVHGPMSDYNRNLGSISPQYIGGARVKEQQKKLWEEGKYGQYAMFNLGMAAEGIKHLWTSLEHGEKSPGLLRLASSSIGLGFEMIGDVFNVGTRAVERAISPTIVTADVFARGRLPEGDLVRDVYETLQDIPVVRTVAQLVIGTLAQIDPTAYEYEGGEKLTGREIAEEFQQKQIWKMGYTAAWDSMAREEYMRRFVAGEDPRLLAMDLENPIAELFGQIAFDPMTVYGKWAGARKAAQMKLAGEIKTARTAAGLEDIPAALGRVMTSGATDEVAEGLRGVAETVTNVVGEMRQGIVKEGAKRGIRVLTDVGKQFVHGGDAQNQIKFIMAHFGDDADSLFEYLEGVVKLAGTPEEAVEALGQIQKAVRGGSRAAIPIEMTLSPQGLTTAIYMREMMTDAATGLPKSIAQLYSKTDDLPQFIERVNDMMQGTVKRMNPSLADEIKQVDKYAELLESGDEAAAATHLRKYPQAANEVSDLQRTMSKADAAMQKFIYKPAGAIQGVLYMGLSPAYRMRNKIMNTFQILVDQGPVAAAKSIFSPAKAEKTLLSYIDFIPPRAKAAFGPAGGLKGAEPGGGILNYFSRGAARDEAAASMHVYSKSVQDTMRKSIKAGVADVAEHLPSYGAEQQKLVQQLYHRYNGKPEDVVEAIRGAAAEGGISVTRNFTFMSEEDIVKLQDLGVYDEARDAILASETLDDALNKIDEIESNFREFGRQTHAEPVGGLPYNTPLEEAEIMDLANYEDGLRQIGMSQGEIDRQTDLFERKIAARREARRGYTEAAEKTKRRAHNLLIHKAQESGLIGEDLTDAVDEVMDVTTQYTRTMREDAAEATKLRVDDLRTSTRSAVKRSKGVRNKDVLRRMWAEAQLGPVPADITPGALRNALWENYFTESDKAWKSFNSQHAWFNYQESMQLAVASGMDLNMLEEIFQPAEHARKYASLFDDAVMDGTTAYANVPRQQLHDSVATRWAEMSSIPEQGLVGDPDVFTAHIERVRASGLSAREALDAGYFDGDMIEIAEEFGNPEEVFDFLLSAPERAEGFAIAEFEGFNIASIGGAELSYVDGDVPKLQMITVPEAERGEGVATSLVDELLNDFSARGVGQVEITDTVSEAGAGLRDSLVESGRLRQVDENIYDIIQREEDAFRMSLETRYVDGTTPTAARVAQETNPARFESLDQLRDGLRENWGQMRSVTMSPAHEQELLEHAKIMGDRMAKARGTAVAVADETRAFILHDYPKRYGLDTLLGYMFPYQFWYSRTYANWMKRMASHPQWMSRYSLYRSYLEKEHAALPDWWKYNLNSNEVFGFLGMKSENPLFFNLEATLNPLNGMTGVDFNDPRKRVDWFSGVMDDMSKFGPSMWTPYQLALAMKYHSEGKDDAASRWAGRLTTGTRFIRDATSMLGMNEGKGYEIDPFVNFFSGGIDPYERARVGRQLGGMVGEGKYSEADIVDAGYNQTGPIWEEAYTRAVNERSVGNTFAFFAGTGFKPRSENDVLIDRFYSEKAGLQARRGQLTEEEYRQGWDALRQKYPFMDTLLLSRKGGQDRDEALAWNVFSRIAPGQQDDIAEMVNMDYDVVGKFYEDKGDMSKWDKGDQLEFMAGVMRIGALLEVPDFATRSAWNAARSEYRSMLKAGERQFGENIWTRVDAFYASEDKDAYLRNNPVVQQAMDWKAQSVITNPIMAPYYTSIDRIEKHLMGRFYREMEKKHGNDLWDHFEVWGQLKDMGEDKAARRYWKDHPQMGGYMDDKEEQLPIIMAELERLAAAIPEDLPMLWREGEEPEEPEPDSSDHDAWIRAQVASYASGGAGVAQQPQGGYWAEVVLSSPGGRELYNLVLDHFQTGDELPPVAERRLQELGVLEQLR